MTTKAEWRLATNNARCPWCEHVGQIVQTRDAGEYRTRYTFSCSCRGKHEYFDFTVVKKPKTPPYILFKLTAGQPEVLTEALGELDI